MAFHIKQFLDNLTSANSTNNKRLLLEKWPTIIGNLHEHVSLEKVTENGVILIVYDSCWLQELYLLTPFLLKKINETLDQPFVKHIHFRLRAKRSPTEQRQMEDTESPLPVKSPLSERETEALKKVSDEALRKALLDFYKQCNWE